jgi:exopolysaccharide biosynthesis polyprenyl glycosylphosphotransferase
VASGASTEPIPEISFAARLIPGSATGSKNRNHGHGYDTAGQPTTVGATPVRRWRLEQFREYLLPSPVPIVGERHRLYAAVVTDYVSILLSWLTVAVLYESSHRHGLALSHPHEFSMSVLRSAAFRYGFGFAVITTLLAFSEGLYRPVSPESKRLTTARVIKSASWSGVLVWMISEPLRRSVEESLLLVLAVFLSVESMLIVHRFQSHRGAALRDSTRNVLIVGSGPVGQALAAQIADHPETGRRFRGFLDDVSTPSFGVLGSPKDLPAIARAEFADEIILAAPGRRELSKMVIREARRNHLDVKMVPDLFGLGTRESWIETIGEIPVVTLHREELPLSKLHIKRVLDVVVASCALIMATPGMLAIAALIRIDSRGPVFYRAKRVGRKGRQFLCYKLRTMEVGANSLRDAMRKRNQRDGPCFKLVEDPRVTRIGHWLRRYSIDELPQLWNVLNGEMSLVGPRPHPVDDVARYELNHLRRLDVTPGMTGLWQVTARQNRSFRTNMELDLEYIERWSIWMDIRILWKTLRVVVRGTGV